MAANIPGYAMTATKLADGNVQMVWYQTLDGLNPYGGIRFAWVLSSANFTALNTTVNGGSTGAALTQVNPENTYSSDYPNSYVAGA